VKKLLSVLIAIVVVMAFTVPVFALNTEVTISSGSGESPIVKCKWEQEPDNNLTYPVGDVTAPSVANYLESGDVNHVTAMSQFNPPMHKNATKTIEYFAVVTDAENMGDVANVFALVFHPINSPAPYGTFSGVVPDPGAEQGLANLFKYKVEFTNLGHDAAQISKVLAANTAHLVKFNDGYVIGEIAGLATSEMNKGTADLWRGTAEIDYEQPGGCYTVRDYAIDTNNNYSTALQNQFLYVETAGVEVDFNKFNYGPINLHFHTVRAGDLTWDGTGTAGFGSYGASVRNIGNVWTKVKVNQNDMAFGNHAGSNPVTTYDNTNAPSAAESNWNVYYDLRLGSTGDEWFYDPNVTHTTPEWMGLSTIEELDFSIVVNQGSGTHSGTMTISPLYVPFTAGPAIGTNDP
jgi:hypothetical protein